MKYIKDFGAIIESKSTEHLDEAVNASGYIKAGKLGYNDQFLGRRSLSWTLSVDLGLKATDQYVGPWIGFDHVSMYAIGKKGGTILDDALTNKYTYEELKSAAAKYLGIEESAEVNEAKKLGLGDKGVDYNDNVVEIIAIGNYNKIAKMLKKETGNDPEDYGYEKAPGNYYLTKNIEATEGNVGDVAMYPVRYDMANYWGLDPVKESLTEASKLIDEETGKVVKLPYKTRDFRGDSITVKGFTDPHKSSSSGRIQTDKGEFFPGVAGVKIVGHQFESMNEAKKFKPGDKWSSDFDYDGMLKYALKVNEKTPIKMLNKLFDSATDVNYHTPFANLGIAIDWIEDGDKAGAKDYIKNFHEDIKKEIKNQS